MEDEATTTPPKRKRTEEGGTAWICRKAILKNIKCVYLVQDRSVDHEQLDEIIDLMLETACTARRTTRIVGDDYPAELVKSKHMKLTGEHTRFALDYLRENTTRVRNIRQYLRVVLFNAPSTIPDYYTAFVIHNIVQPGWGEPESDLPNYSCGEDGSLQREKEDDPVKQGALIPNERTDHCDTRFGLADYYGGLCCRKCFDVMIDDK